MRKRHMYLFAALFVASTSIFTSCLEEKDYYDPNFKTENPLEDISAPSNFDWKTTNTVGITVSVNDEFDGAYNYLIEVFDKNPVISPDAILFTRGFAKKGLSFVTKITVPTTTEHVFIRQTTPTGLASVRMVSTDADIHCNFGSNANTRATRSGVDIPDFKVDYTPPSHSDASIFPTKAPANATDVMTVPEEGGMIPLPGGTADAYRAYTIAGNAAHASIGSDNDYVELYITEDVTLYELAIVENIKIFILPGKKLTVGSMSSVSDGCILSIGADATLEVHGEGGLTVIVGALYNLGTITTPILNAEEEAVIYNAGMIHATGSWAPYWCSIRITGADTVGPLLYNMGTIVTDTYFVVGKLGTIYNGGVINAAENLELSSPNGADPSKIINFVNDNEVNCLSFRTEGNVNIQNNGEITAFDEAGFSSTEGRMGNPVMINNGTLIARSFGFGGDGLYNRCKIIAHEMLSFSGKVIFDAGAYMYTGGMALINEARVEMGSNAFLHANTAIFIHGVEFYGTGTGEKALLVLNEATNTFITRSEDDNTIRYDGNLQVVCDDHVTDGWTLTNGAEFASQANNTVGIPVTPCNPGWVPNPTIPTNPDPEDVVDPLNYTYLFEDQWPLYGDYDMNDVVIRVSSITKTPDADNKVSKLSFTYQLEAVGAYTAAGAALMLDGIPASNIQSVTYSDKAPTGFDTASSGAESGQTTAVIPLFANAHNFLGKGVGTFINTQKGNSNNVSGVPSVTVIVTFATPVDMTFEVSSFNPFIITDSSSNISSDARKEVHQRGYQPSRKANAIFFGSGSDASTSGTYYASEENLVWCFVIPNTFRWPVEYKNIQEAYTGFAGWVQSGGVNNPSWWQSPATGDYVY